MEELLAKLCYSQLVQLHLHQNSISLEFSFGVNKVDAVIHLNNIIHTHISHTIDDEGGYVVGEISITPIDDGGAELLPRLRYNFFDSNGSVLTYAHIPLFHIHLDGDIYIDVVCANVQVLKNAE